MAARHSDRLRQFGRALAVHGALLGLAPNVAFGLINHFARGDRALINVDYFIVAAVAALFPGAPFLTVLMVFAAVVVDALFTLGPAFNFTPAELPRTLLEIRHLGTLWLLALVGVALALSIVPALLVRRVSAAARDRPSLAVALLALGLAAIGVDVANGTGPIVPRELARTPFNTATSGTRWLWQSVASSRAIEPTAPSTAARVHAASDALMAAAQSHGWDGPDKVLLVLVESFGVLSDSGAMKALVAQFQSAAIASRYVVRFGTIPSHGATTSGEFRELCGRQMNHVRAPRSPVPDCLPALLRMQGFATHALHGFEDDLFARHRWYPHVGFDSLHFRADIAASRRMAECGIMFRGICDTTMVDAVAERLQRRTTRDFIYWLTLSTHFPLDPRLARASHFDCSSLGTLRSSERVCRYAGVLAPVLDRLARLAADSLTPATWMLIVGDHPPPFARNDPHAFAPDVVPFIELRPRTVK